MPRGRSLAGQVDAGFRLGIEFANEVAVAGLGRVIGLEHQGKFSHVLLGDPALGPAVQVAEQTAVAGVNLVQIGRDARAGCLGDRKS